MKFKLSRRRFLWTTGGTIAASSLAPADLVAASLPAVSSATEAVAATSIAPAVGAAATAIVATAGAMVEALEWSSSGMGYDRRTPLCNISMALRLMSKLLDDPSQTEISPDMLERLRRYVQIAQDQARHGIEVFNDWTDQTKFYCDYLKIRDRDKSSKELHPLHLQTWLPECLIPLQYRLKADEKSIRIQVADSLPIVIGHQSLLSEMVQRLLNHAIRLIPAGETVTLSANVIAPSASLTDSPHLQISVTSPGVEIPLDNLPKLFEPLYEMQYYKKFEHSDESPMSGSNLVLVACTAQELGGTVQATSSAGQTTFTVSIPVQVVSS
ncbi:MAG: hypothetical protein DCF22_18565 [Leptolyngbya sp.]|nr:MAG: hypothetical protein DCF22_18565 [Leptolyngbya sp.]